MAQAVPSQHPAVVLRSHYVHLRALLAVAMVAVVGLTVAVVILATHDEAAGTASIATPVNQAASEPAQRADGGPEESNVAAAVGTEPTVASPDESKIAAAIGSNRASSSAQSGPDESKVAAAISGP
jgi:hypothetical protein